jgi:HK97 family phage portal protein
VGRTLLDPLRALRNLATPVPFTTSSGSPVVNLPWNSRNDAVAQMRAMGTVGALFAIIHRTSTSTAKVNWRLYRKARSGNLEDRTEVTSHAVLDLWNKPNSFYTRQEFVETEQQHVDLTGEGWWVLAHNARSALPLEIWPVRPDRMVPVPSATNFLDGYMYLSPGGQQIALTRDQVIQLRMPNPMDPYRGMGPVQSILPDLDASRYSAVWNANFFRNSAEPGGIIQLNKGVDDAEFDKLSRRWNEQHKGVANAHRVAIIEEAQWVDRKISQRDMQFAELRTITSDMIREAFGIPKFAVGVITDINRATADAAKAWFAEELTVPRLERFKQALNNDLLPMYGATTVGLEFDFDDPVPPNQESVNATLSARALAAAALRDAGWDPDDILSAVGLPAMGYTIQAPAAPPAPPAPAARADQSFAELAAGILNDGKTPTWTVHAHEDVDTCRPCSDNDGHEYPTQAAAYADYPGGKGYVECLGKTSCRCVVKEDS